MPSILEDPAGSAVLLVTRKPSLLSVGREGKRQHATNASEFCLGDANFRP